MSETSKSKDFPDLSAKLSAPKKASLFERQKAEAEAKKAREEAATAAVYEDFVKSFDDEGSVLDKGNVRHGPPAGSYGPGPGKRHFTSTTGRSSGPGSLGPTPPVRNSGPGSLGPASSAFGRKRGYEDTLSTKRSHGMFAYDESSGPKDPSAAFNTSDDEDDRHADSRAEDKAAARPTLQLLSLPPGTSAAVIKSLIPGVLTVENIKISNSQGPASNAAPNTERRSSTAIVTLAKETPASDIDTVVNSLQNRYLGWGHYLSLSRHLSSAAVNSGLLSTQGLTSGTNQPFGARPISQVGSLNRAPPPSHRGGFAPPNSYNSQAFGRNPPGVQVTVQPPNDLKQLKLIHKTLEALLTYGPEFEALLMSRLSVQREEKWAWLWNARSTGGVYYRWRLWELVTSSSGPPKHRIGGDGQLLFDRGAMWLPPDQGLQYEYTTEMEEFVSDPDYDSSDEEDEDNRRERHNVSGAPPEGGIEGQTEGSGYLTPIARAKLVHLLSRLPETNARLRKGDIARITAFAIEHAGAGADEVVSLITSNVLFPMSHTKANPNLETNKIEDDGDHVSDGEGRDGTPTVKGTIPNKVDMTAASLVGLYIISDILSSSSTSGVRHAWRYRSLFESAIKKQAVFQQLGRVDKELGWGKLKAEKWKRSVHSVFSLWEGWCVFPQVSHDIFVDNFDNPPVSEAEKAEIVRDEERKQRAAEEDKKARSKWKSVQDADEPPEDQSMADADGNDTIDEEMDGEGMLGDEDLDGEPMVDSSDEEEVGDTTMREPQGTGKQLQESEPAASSKSTEDNEEGGPSQQPQNRRQRPTAADMFAAESDDD